ncbi:integral membrane protein, Mpv17/PMP22 family [Teratosphaeria destructans]|uniref:Integral membrane protein, Mpv17/PMP22 family n=1 Tax=Teratosphaeria destructans TaxID=418781 RepID=A0A9W7SSH3_9PEZI|nr:integral membrane protein, Mpv17/PMP22 family [Teratosphaeria destructans]
MDAPIVKAAVQAATLSALSNILGQLITCYQSKTPFHLNTTQLTHFVLFSLLATPPNYLWQAWLEAQFPGYTQSLPPPAKEDIPDDAITTGRGDATATSTRHRPTTTADEKPPRTLNHDSLATPPAETRAKLHLGNTAAKFALDQTLGAGVNTLLFIAGIALLRGQSWESVQEQVRGKFWPMIFAGQKLWPAVSVLSFTVVPLEHRTLFGSVVGLFWGVYLSLVSAGGK